MYRACIISATYPPDVCGVGDYTSQLSRALCDAGIQVTVITSSHKNDQAIDEPSIKNDVKRLISKWSLKAIPCLIREIHSGQYDLVHIQYTPSLYGRPTIAINLLPWLLIISGCPTYVTLHEVYTPILHGFRNVLMGVYDRIKDTLIMLGSTGVIVTVPDRVTRLSKLFPWLRHRLHAIPAGSGVRVEQITIDERNRQRAGFEIHPDDFVIGSFGSLHTDKRYESLFRAARRLLDRGYRIRVVLIGAYDERHPYFKCLKKYIDDLKLEAYIIWTGFGTPSQVSHWLAMLDVYVMTDLRGASGRKSSLITALAHRLPIVSTRSPDTTRDFEHGENILLAGLEDEDRLVQHIEQLSQHPDDRERLGLNAYRLYESHYSWDIIGRKTIEVYRQFDKQRHNMQEIQP